MSRVSTVSRTTKETSILCSVDLDGKGEYEIQTGIGFFDHMLEQIAKHSFTNISLSCKGDLEVDQHHTIEDVGIALGDAFDKALGNKAGIKRYGQFYLPMDETLVLVALDLCGRPYLVFDAEFTTDKVGNMPTEMVEEFFRAMVNGLKMNLHIKVISGKNNHHMIEAMFKGFAKAFDIATQKEPRLEGVFSTKGVL